METSCPGPHSPPAPRNGARGPCRRCSTRHWPRDGSPARAHGPRVVDALAGQDLLRMLLPKSMGRARKPPLVEILQGLRGDRLGRCQRRLVRQSVERLGRVIRRRHAARGGGRHVRRPRGAGLAWGRPAQTTAAPCGVGRRLPPDRHLELRQRRSSHQNGWAPTAPCRIPTARRTSATAGRDDRSFLFLREQADDHRRLGACSGCAATGSDSYSVKDLFVPDAHAPAARRAGRAAGEGADLPDRLDVALCQRLLQRDPGARTAGCWRPFTELGARGKHSRSAPTVHGSQTILCSGKSALLEAKLSAARAFLHEAAGQVYDASAAGTLDVDLRLRLRLATTYGNERGDRRLDRLLSAPPARRRSRRRRPSSAASATR